MTSSDYDQLSTVINRLGRLLSLLSDPMQIVNVLVETISQVEHPPSGDPDEIRHLATAFRTAAGDIASVSVDVRKIGATHLPDVWRGEVADKASQVVTSTADLVGAAPPSFNTAAIGLEAYATTLESLVKRHEELHGRLREAWHTLTHMKIFGVDVPAVNIAELGHWVVTVSQMIRGCIHVYGDWRSAADTLVAQLADAQGAARTAGAVKAGMKPVDAVVLADIQLDSNMSGSTVLNTAQLKHAAALMNAMPPADRAKLDALLAAAKSTDEKAYILKTLAAGHSLADLTRFADQIRGKDPDWLTRHLSLIDPNNPQDPVSYVDDSGRHRQIQQLDPTNCGSTAIVLARASSDPSYSLDLTTDGHGHDNADDFITRLAEEEKRTHNATNSLWPQAAGTTLWGMASGMNQHADELGAHYGARWVDDTDPNSVNPAMRDAIRAVDAGHTVPVLLAPSASEAIHHGGEMHYVLLIGHQNGYLTVYDPGGPVTQIPDADFRNGNLQALDRRARHVNGLILPNS